MSRTKIKLQTITPAMAKRWLEITKRAVEEEGFPRRPLKQNQLKKLERTYRNREWKPNTETIKIDPKGRVVDGNHRLAASVRSGCSFKSYVAYNVPADWFSTIDQGVRRSITDVLAAEGEKSYRHLGAALNTLYLITSPAEAKHYGLSPIEALDLLNKHEGLRHSVELCLSQWQFARIWSVGRAAGLHYCCSISSDPAHAEEFWRPVGTGLDLRQTRDPRYYLRNRLIELKTHKEIRLFVNFQIELAVRCWNMWWNEQNVPPTAFKLIGDVPPLEPTE